MENNKWTGVLFFERWWDCHSCMSGDLFMVGELITYGR